MSANQDQDPAADRKRGATAEKVSALGKSEPRVKPPREAKKKAESEASDAKNKAKSETKSETKNKAKKKTAPKKPSAPRAPTQKAAPAPSNGAGAPAPHPNLEKFARLDIEAIADNMAQLVDQGRKALAAAIGGVNPDEARSELAANVADATKTLGAVAEYWLSKPDRAAVAQADLYKGLSEIWRQTLRRYGGEDVAPIVPSDRADKRFSGPEWNDNPFFDWLRQSYLLASRWAGDMVESAEGLDPQTKARAVFYTRLISSAISPSNFVPTNPELLRATMDAKGENLVRGLKMLAEDISAGGGVLKIRQSADQKFELGVDMANTPGKVIWRNDVMELIQYEPTTAEVYARPLLITPPWINKFYVLDLNPEKSFVRWAVEQGFTVFIISWVNPDETKATKGFEAYMHEGVLTALDVIEKATGERKVTAAGYCVGGTLLALTLAYMAATGDDRIDSVTLFATQVDFSDAGDLQIFVDEARLVALDESMARTGYLEGYKMANAFNMLRPNELIWNYVVNNYMKGVEPAAFDLLYWNSDSTRIPRANHSFYLRSCYLENRLARGEMVIDDVRLNLRQVKAPVFEIATREDHIAPAQSVFRGARFFGGDVTFVLGGSGHIAGIINPPSKDKYQYWTGGPAKGAFEEWIKKAKETKGSWWPHWLGWVTAQAPKKVPARQPGGGKLKIICDAPGEYVRVRG
ncbi:class I poly(R)-hydroxyalkanoic acid synthase [Methylocystis sp. H62]|uniref:class I poly(R)-hydroxyalkanoic acid synthase n=1 Tax=Methylocystis sp. H62 TaxID=2785789 RepID=UPI0018C33CF9|nr:class I poly(R)-hydroxyalkanoic acid synthase [Methylocystis sp. H62]MBG0793880.1 class I poly(R)-hydroxyalkanoic acid synthase [Methylocystis sp. H62]